MSKMQKFDCLVVADARFSGGSTSAVATDVMAMSDLGLRVGLLFVRSAYLDDSRDPVNPKALGLVDLPGVTRLSPGDAAQARLAFLHHPLVFARGIEERSQLRADRSVIVAHHPPFRADGSLEYNPLEAIWKARTALGLTPWIAPISGQVRAQMAAFSPAVRQTAIDWPNVFELSEWQSTRPVFSDPDLLTIGRHGRQDALKFPGSGVDIDAALPTGPGLRARVLGCPAAELGQRGAHPDRWEVLAFGAEPVPAFLNTLDIFVYHYHPHWVEAFGRTIVEAGLCERPLLLDPRLKPTFGDLAAYCHPQEVRDAVTRIAADPEAARHRADAMRRQLIDRYATASLGPRLEQIAQDVGTVSRQNTTLSPLQLARKLSGHYRRRLLGQTG